MKIKIIVAVLFAAFITTHQAQSQQLPVATVCTPNFPSPLSTPFLALGNSCSLTDLQAACDTYINTPYFGKAKPTGPCITFKTVDEIRAYLSSLNPASKPRFAGFGGNAVVCQVKGSKTMYAEITQDCNPSTLIKTCGDNAGPASPCQTFNSDIELKAFLDKNPKSGAECKVTASGTAYRVIVPACIPQFLNTQCPPANTVVKSCGIIGSFDLLSSWVQDKFINKALVSCKIKKTGTTFKRPARDCDADTQRSACPVDSTDPVGCQVYGSFEDQAKSYA